MKRLIKGGTAVTPEDAVAADVLIEDGKIAAIGENLAAGSPDAEIIDAGGKILFPGFIDPHTHLEMTVAAGRTADDFATGTAAALAGGTTTVLDFAGQDKGVTLTQTLKDWHQKADGKSSCDYGFHIGLAEWNDETKKELREMPDEGISSVKLYMAYDALMLDDAQIFETLRLADELGMTVSAHCENGLVIDELIEKYRKEGCLTPKYHPLSRPAAMEAEAVNRFLAIAEQTGSTVYVVHLSTQRGLRACLDAKERGQKLYIETCPQYLCLDDSCYDLPDFESAKYVFAPPARKVPDQKAIRQAIFDGIIDTAGSDHCSFDFGSMKQKGRDDFSKIPNGIPGVETRPQLMFTETYAGLEGGLSYEDFSDLMSANAAKIYGMYPQKGALPPGSDADIVIWDPDWTGEITHDALHMNVDYSPYEGYPVRGRADEVLLHGETAYKDGAFVKKNAGHYVRRQTKQA